MTTERIDGTISESKLGQSWLQKSFQTKNSVTAKGVDADVLFARVYTSAMMKFTNTTPGGNYSLNPLPQASLWTDPPPFKGERYESLPDYRKSPAQGGFYSEIYDDNQQVVYFRFGLPVFNSLTGFYSRFYNSQYAKLVRTGGASGTLLGALGEGLGKLIGSPFGAAAFVFNTIGGIFNFIGDAYDFLNRRSSSLYYFKPAMPLYWGAAQTILNHIAVNKGFLSPVTTEEGQPSKGMPSFPAGADIAYLHQQFPDIITEKGNINLVAIAGRAQRMFNNAYEHVKDLGASRADTKQKLVAMYRNGQLATLNNPGHDTYHHTDIETVHARWFSTPGLGASSDPVPRDGTNDENVSIKEGMSSLWDMVKANTNDGMEFVGFRVNNTGGVQETFTNSFRESELGQWINSTSSTARSTKFSLNNFNISDNPLANFAEGTIEGLSNMIGSFTDSIGLSGFSGILMGNAYADIPKFWDRADVTFPTKSYTVDLITPSGDVYSQIINLYSPLSCLIAGAMVRSTGRHSYTEPFLCQVFDKGRAQTRLGMIKSLSIQRGGSGNVAWTNNQEPLHIRVTIDVEDMESVMHMPLVEKFGSGGMEVLGHTAAKLLGEVNTLFEGGWFSLDTPFTDYMAVLGSLDLTAQIYNWEILKRRWRINSATTDIKKSDAYLASGISNNVIGDIAKMFVSGTFPR